jgi:hypothetical protein
MTNVTQPPTPLRTKHTTEHFLHLHRFAFYSTPKHTNLTPTPLHLLKTHHDQPAQTHNHTEPPRPQPHALTPSHGLQLTTTNKTQALLISSSPQLHTTNSKLNALTHADTVKGQHEHTLPHHTRASTNTSSNAHTRTHYHLTARNTALY